MIDDDLIAGLERAASLDTTHLPGEVGLIRAFRTAFPHVPQVACFDTVFHRDMPTAAQLLPLPLRYAEGGMRRLGFHGISFSYLMQELHRLDADRANRRVILAHLGSGSSMAAVLGGRPLDTTMSFTPLSGLVMSTRPGDIDPGVVLHIMRQEGWSPQRMDAFLNQECGLLGMSGTSSDMRDLLERIPNDSRAADAVAVFCMQARRWIGALTAVLGGLDVLVFSGGMGGHSPAIRTLLCSGCEYLSLHLDEAANQAGTGIISSQQSRVQVRVIPTDEEAMIASLVIRMTPDRADHR